MANFQTLYNDYGLQGILPYAFQRGGEAYQFVLDKLKTEAPFFVIRHDEFTTPIIDYENYISITYIFTAQDLAEKFCEVCAKHGWPAHPDPVNAGREDFWTEVRDLGMDGIKVDNLIVFPIGDFVAPAPYDGFLSVNDPLRNEILNPIFLRTMQDEDAGNPTDNQMEFLFMTLKKSTLLMPYQYIYENNSEEIREFREEDTRIPYINMETYAGDTINVVPIFTDSKRFRDFAREYDGFNENFALFIKYENITYFLKNNEGYSLLLNPDRGGLLITREFQEKMEEIIERHEKDGYQVKHAEDDDPMPEFLR